MGHIAYQRNISYNHQKYKHIHQGFNQNNWLIHKGIYGNLNNHLEYECSRHQAIANYIYLYLFNYVYIVNKFMYIVILCRKFVYLYTCSRYNLYLSERIFVIFIKYRYSIYMYYFWLLIVSNKWRTTIN